jgi:hypothetical protein
LVEGENFPFISHMQKLYALLPKFLLPRENLLPKVRSANQKNVDKMLPEVVYHDGELPEYATQQREVSEANKLRYLRLMKVSLQILASSSKNIVGQTLILYQDNLNYFHKPIPIMGFAGLIQHFYEVLQTEAPITDNNLVQWLKVQHSFVHFLLRITSNPIKGQLYFSEKRKKCFNAIVSDGQDKIEPDAFVNFLKKYLTLVRDFLKCGSLNTEKLVRLPYQIELTLSGLLEQVEK